MEQRDGMRKIPNPKLLVVVFYVHSEGNFTRHFQFSCARTWQCICRRPMEAITRQFLHEFAASAPHNRQYFVLNF